MLKPRKQIMKGMGWGLMAFAFTASTTCAADGFAVNVTGGEGGLPLSSTTLQTSRRTSKPAKRISYRSPGLLTSAPSAGK